jgi:hypothetical protein
MDRTCFSVITAILFVGPLADGAFAQNAGIGQPRPQPTGMQPTRSSAMNSSRKMPAPSAAAPPNSTRPIALSSSAGGSSQERTNRTYASMAF